MCKPSVMLTSMDSFSKVDKHNRSREVKYGDFSVGSAPQFTLNINGFDGNQVKKEG